MYVPDKNGGNQGRTSDPLALTPRNVMTLSSSSLGRLKGFPVSFSLPCSGLGCVDCDGRCGSPGGMGALDLRTLGIGGYAALGLGLWLATQVLFTGGRAKERRAALRKVDADYTVARDQVKAKYPRL